jgi:Transposase DDE domain group 1
LSSRPLQGGLTGNCRSKQPRAEEQGCEHKQRQIVARPVDPCTSATANQFRLLIHTAAYWLLHTLRGLAPKTSFWRAAQFDTIRIALIKVAARITEMVTRIKVALPSCDPHQTSWALLAARAIKLPP